MRLLVCTAPCAVPLAQACRSYAKKLTCTPIPPMYIIIPTASPGAVHEGTGCFGVESVPCWLHFPGQLPSCPAGRCLQAGGSCGPDDDYDPDATPAPTPVVLPTAAPPPTDEPSMPPLTDMPSMSPTPPLDCSLHAGDASEYSLCDAIDGCYFDWDMGALGGCRVHECPDHLAARDCRQDEKSNCTFSAEYGACHAYGEPVACRSLSNRDTCLSMDGRCHYTATICLPIGENAPCLYNPVTECPSPHCSVIGSGGSAYCGDFVSTEAPLSTDAGDTPPPTEGVDCTSNAMVAGSYIACDNMDVCTYDWNVGDSGACRDTACSDFEIREPCDSYTGGDDCSWSEEYASCHVTGELVDCISFDSEACTSNSDRCQRFSSDYCFALDYVIPCFYFGLNSCPEDRCSTYPGYCDHLTAFETTTTEAPVLIPTEAPVASANPTSAPTARPTPAPQPPPTDSSPGQGPTGAECTDVPGWSGSGDAENDCTMIEELESAGIDECSYHQAGNSMFDMSAGAACCVCGGGIVGSDDSEDPTIATEEPVTATTEEPPPPPFIWRGVGNCNIPGYSTIATEEDCFVAATILSANSTDVLFVEFALAPHGCFYKLSTDELFFNPRGIANHTDTNRVSLCQVYISTTQSPSSAPSPSPSSAPTSTPTSLPSVVPTREPTNRPTPQPTEAPSLSPSTATSTTSTTATVTTTTTSTTTTAFSVIWLCPCPDGAVQVLGHPDTPCQSLPTDRCVVFPMSDNALVAQSSNDVFVYVDGATHRSTLYSDSTCSNTALTIVNGVNSFVVESDAQLEQDVCTHMFHFFAPTHVANQLYSLRVWLAAECVPTAEGEGCPATPSSAPTPGITTPPPPPPTPSCAAVGCEADQYMLGAPCHCDASCIIAQDCCSDYVEVCLNRPPVPVTSDPTAAPPPPPATTDPTFPPSTVAVTIAESTATEAPPTLPLAPPPTAPPTTAPPTTPPPTQPSCSGLCGSPDRVGVGFHTCHCDAACASVVPSDCCADYETLCVSPYVTSSPTLKPTLTPSSPYPTPAPSPSPTTRAPTTHEPTPEPTVQPTGAERACAVRGCGAGGYVQGAECQCEWTCLQYEDCCGDYEAVCSETTTPEPTTTTERPACVAREDQCQTCNTDSSRCIVCRNRHLLHPGTGTCVATCPGGFRAVGNGVFSRRCEATQPPTLPPTHPPTPPPTAFPTRPPTPPPAYANGCQSVGCERCSAEDGTLCDICMTGRYLLDGACIARCPVGYFPELFEDPATAGDTAAEWSDITTPRYRRRCVQLSGPISESTDAPGPTSTCVERGSGFCHRCNQDSTACTLCRDRRYLYNGVCLDDCPGTTTPQGRGNFQRQCLTVTPTAPPSAPETDLCATRRQDRSSHCNACNDDSTACTQCREQHYLHQGQCIAACPAGFAGLGIGRFNRVCLAETHDACQARENDCHACSSDGQQCVKCRNQAYLAHGVCAASCPEGWTMQGRGNFNRVCINSAPGDGGTGDDQVGDACVNKRDGCHRCTDSTTCEFCREEQYLHEGTCHPGCPDGYAQQGTGLYRRQCVLN